MERQPINLRKTEYRVEGLLNFKKIKNEQFCLVGEKFWLNVEKSG